MDAEFALERLMGFFEPVVQLLQHHGVSHDPAFYGLFVLLAAVWIGFALWGAETAGQGGRSRVTNFIICLAIPVVYAAILPAIIRRRRKRRWRRTKEEEARRRDKKIVLSESRRRRPLGGLAKDAGKDDRPSRPRTGDTQLFPVPSPPPAAGDNHEEIAAIKGVLQRQHRRQKESSAPVRLRITYGNYQVVSESILEMLPPLVVVETVDDRRGKKSEALRIPLARITRIEREGENGAWHRIDLAGETDGGPGRTSLINSDNCEIGESSQP